MSDWKETYKREIREKPFWTKLKEDLHIYSYGQPLTKTEEHWHLPVNKVHSVSAPDDHRAILRLNSSFLEVINPPYGHKGIGLALGIPAIPAVLFIISLMIASFWGDFFGNEPFSLLIALFDFALVSLMSSAALCLLYALYQDIWPYTHYPIRFCRKSRMVYVIQRKKTTLSIPWEQLYFHMSVNGEFIPGTGEYRWMLRAYQLDENKCVKHSFFISPWVESNAEMEHLLLPYWEYIRRYMEEGPQSVPVPKFMIPVGEERESLSLCWQQLKFRYLEGSAFGYVFLAGL